MKNTPLSRRNFLKGLAVASSSLALFNIVPAHAAPRSKQSKANPAVPPSERINLAIIGCSNQGGNIGEAAIGTGLVNVVALCDVQAQRTGHLKKMAGEAAVFQDFRQMFDKIGGKIDACTIGVPDHSHFPIAMLAMSLGKHVYVEKPLAHTFQEVDLMIAAAKKRKLACQMGNQGHSGNNYLQFKAWVEAGVIKNVRKIDAFMNEGRRWHAWGNITEFPKGIPPPDGMDWDTWIGTAPFHPYDTKYDPGNWRGWYEFGGGAMGDWGPHIIDTIHQFLELGLPHEIKAAKIVGRNRFIFPMASTITFEFAERRKDMPALTLSWYDGVNNEPPRPRELEEGRKISAPGKIIYSDDLVFKGGSHESTLRIIPESKMKDLAPTLPKITDKNSSHMMNYLLSVKGKETCRSSFDVAGPLTQVILLGIIAQRLGETLKFDTQTRQITNNAAANLLLNPSPRKGWEEFYRL